MTILNLILVAVLIAGTAFFVATEFAIVKLRPSRVDQLVLEGRRNSKAVKEVTGNLDGYLSACQLGITITALGLGWLGKPTVETLLYPIFVQFALPAEVTSLVAFIIAFSLITFLHVVVGELAPKSWAIQRAEDVSLLLARPIIFFYKIMYPFIWLLNGSANRLIRLFGLRPAKEHEEAHSEEELRIILTESYESGKINPTEYGYVSRIFTFDNLLAREIMVPRTDMACLYLDKSLEENIRIMRNEQYTRFPVALNNKDHIVGIINTKQFFLQYQVNSDMELKSLVQPVLTVQESTPVKLLLTKMQKEQTHIALLVDEYGGTSGIVTIEDILEEIVGEIRDEFDAEEHVEIEKVSDRHLIVDGKVSLSHLNDLLGTDIETDKLDTIGGWLYEKNPELTQGSKIDFGDITFIIQETSLNRVKKVEVIVHEAVPHE